MVDPIFEQVLKEGIRILVLAGIPLLGVAVAGLLMSGVQSLFIIEDSASIYAIRVVVLVFIFGLIGSEVCAEVMKLTESVLGP